MKICVSRFPIFSLILLSSLFAFAGSPHFAALYTFCPSAGCSDGSTSEAGVIHDVAGNLYGTASQGGANSEGVVFKLAPPQAPDGIWPYTAIYSFCAAASCTDGETPLAGLVMDAAGNLYGTASGGGANSDGVVFKLAPPATL